MNSKTPVKTVNIDLFNNILPQEIPKTQKKMIDKTPRIQDGLTNAISAA